jgi:ketosteroid isomerase-like protein
MLKVIRRALYGCAVLSIVSGGVAMAEECSGTITADEAMQVEDARYKAQTSNDFAAMERLFGEDLIYTHSSAKVDGKASYIESMRSGAVRYRIMKRSDTRVRTYGCLAVITGTANYDVTVEGQDRAVELRFTSIWAKRPRGIQFVSWQATAVPKQ